MHTESRHICLVDTETTKVPALDFYKNSKSKNKNRSFFQLRKKLSTFANKSKFELREPRNGLRYEWHILLVTEQTLSKLRVVEMTTVQGI